MKRRALKVFSVITGVLFLPYWCCILAAKYATWIVPVEHEHSDKRESMIAYVREHSDAQIWGFGIPIFLACAGALFISYGIYFLLSTYIKTGDWPGTD